jgi:hypothetical protein
LLGYVEAPDAEQAIGIAIRQFQIANGQLSSWLFHELKARH